MARKANENLLRDINTEEKVAEKNRLGTVTCSLWVNPQNARLDGLVIEGISGYSMRMGAAKDLPNSGESMPIIMHRGRWSKMDTVMRYLEHSNFER